MSIFFTSDLHLDHAKVIEYCNRPFADVNEMNEALIANWNERVGPEDVVYLLGDFALTSRAKLEEFRRRLTGKIHIVRGNHDRGPKALAECGFNAISKEFEGFTHDTGGAYLYMRHFPNPDWSSPYTPAYHLHGHVHTQYKRRGNRINVGVDVWDFRPVTLEELLACS